MASVMIGRVLTAPSRSNRVLRRNTRNIRGTNARHRRNSRNIRARVAASGHRA